MIVGRFDKYIPGVYVVDTAEKQSSLSPATSFYVGNIRIAFKIHAITKNYIYKMLPSENRIIWEVVYKGEVS